MFSVSHSPNPHLPGPSTEAVEGEVEMDGQGEGFVNMGSVKVISDLRYIKSRPVTLYLGCAIGVDSVKMRTVIHSSLRFDSCLWTNHRLDIDLVKNGVSPVSHYLCATMLMNTPCSPCSGTCHSNRSQIARVSPSFRFVLEPLLIMWRMTP